MKRQFTAELLDSDSGTNSEIAATFSDIRLVNRAFGGLATTESMIKRVARESACRSLSLLEVAAGSGDMPKTIERRLRAQGIGLRISLLDRAWSHLRRSTNGNGSGPGFPAVAADALTLPFREGSFDLVSCNLFTHHLSAEQTVHFVNEALRVCRIAVLVNDLVRHRLHLALVYAGLPLFRSRMTWHDAPASVRQAYTYNEMQNILDGTRAARVEIRKRFLFRMGVIAWKDSCRG